MRHGGDLTRAIAQYSIPREDWLDLSTGVSPCAYPVPEIPQRYWTALPNPQELEKIAHSVYGVPFAAGIIAAAGSQILIRQISLLRRGAQVSVVSPTYSEHAVAWQRAGCRVVASAKPEPDADVVVVVNPNNPDGRLWKRSALLDMADKLARRDGLLIVDEAFVDTAPENSLAAYADRPGLLILRSFGKFFGLAGLRLGFALGARREIAALRQSLGPWPVSGPGLFIGKTALSDEKWIAQTRGNLQQKSRRLSAILAKFGLEVVGDATLFKLISCKKAFVMHEALARQGIWTRIFDYNPKWLRLGLPADEEFGKLTAGLASALLVQNGDN
jgi:cobalamin biosynthetic protein CobC